MTSDENVSVRSSLVSYFVLWIPIGTLISLFWNLALAGQSDAWSVAGTLFLLGIIGTACLMRLRLTLMLEEIQYRGVFRTVRVSLNNVRAISAGVIGRSRGVGLARGPGFALTIETIVKKESDGNLIVNIKPLDKTKLRLFLKEAKTRGIIVKLDAAITYILKDQKR